MAKVVKVASVDNGLDVTLHLDFSNAKDRELFMRLSPPRWEGARLTAEWARTWEDSDVKFLSDREILHGLMNMSEGS